MLLGSYFVTPVIFCTIKQVQWKKWERTQNSKLNAYIGFGLFISTAKNNTSSHSKTQTFSSSSILLRPEIFLPAFFLKFVKWLFWKLKKNSWTKVYLTPIGTHFSWYVRWSKLTGKPVYHVQLVVLRNIYLSFLLEANKLSLRKQHNWYFYWLCTPCSSFARPITLRQI